MSTCYQRADFERYAAGLVEPDEKQVFQDHVAACEECRRAYEEVQRCSAALLQTQSYTQTMTAPPALPAGEDTSPVGKLARHLPQIEGYRIVGVLGQGGMGIVYHAVQARLNRAVALKVLPAIVGTASPSAVARFRREATAAARLHHTNIVPIYDFGESRDSYYYAMELITGQPFNVLVRRFAERDIGAVAASQLPHAVHSAIVDGPALLPSGSGPSRSADTTPGSITSSATGRGRPYYQQVARWMADAADALHYAHGEGVIHRDIKPSNLILSLDGRIMIADFGLAKLVGEESVTMTGALLGSLRYISPEQAMARRVRVDHRTDIYSLGAVMYELLSFLPAFPGEDDKEVLGAIIARDPIRPRKHNHHVPHELETICLKTLEKSPDARYATARALAEDLRRFIHDLPITAKRPNFVRRSGKFVRRHRAPVIAIAAAVLLSLAAVVVVRVRAESESTRIHALVESGISTGFTAQGSNERHQWETAERKFQQALEIDPTHRKSMLGYVWVRIERLKKNRDLRTDENHAELEGWCRRVLSQDPENTTALNYHGIVLKELGRLDEAIATARRLVELKPDDFAGWSNLGAYHALAGDLDRAAECLRKGIDVVEATEDVEALYQAHASRGLAALEFHQRNQAAIAHIEKAIRLKRDDVPSLVLKARILLQRDAPGDRAEALTVVGHADHFSAGQDALSNRIMALAHLRAGEVVAAIDHAEAAMEDAEAALVLGDMPAINYVILAIAEAQRGNRIGARDRLKDAEQSWPAELREHDFVATYDEGILWFESRAELEGLRAEAESRIAALEFSAPQP